MEMPLYRDKKCPKLFGVTKNFPWHEGNLQGEGTACSITGCDIDHFSGAAALALQVHICGGHTAWLTLWNT